MRPDEILHIIELKRDGVRLNAGALGGFVQALVNGQVPDYQAAAFLMAAYLRGLDQDEIAALTRAITDSGRVLDFSALGPVVDKHSTGGVGDTVSLIAGPLAAASGAIVPMLSGRALGHTGGTLDKLESIPGFRAALDVDAFRRAVEQARVAIVEASAELAPADAVLYRLRDATATVDHPGLIIASILGKKLCVAPRGLVMDLKTGSGSFVGNVDAARRLVQQMSTLGASLGLKIRFLITAMAAPLSSAIGNAIEVERASSILRGERADHAHAGLRGGDLRSLALITAGEMIMLAGQAASPEEGQRRAETALDRGDGLRTFEHMIEAQGGDPRVVAKPELLPRPAVRGEVRAGSDGTVTAIDARGIGQAAASLGVGRGAIGASVDPGAGLELRLEIGEPVRKGDVIATLGGSGSSNIEMATRQIENAIVISAEPPTTRPEPLIERHP